MEKIIKTDKSKQKKVTAKNKIYTVEVFGYAEIEAASKEDAVSIMRQRLAEPEIQTQLSVEVTFPE